MASEPRPRLRMNVVNQVMKNGCSLSLCHDRSMCMQSKPNLCTHMCWDIVEKVFRKSDEASKQRPMILPTNGVPAKNWRGSNTCHLRKISSKSSTHEISHVVYHMTKMIVTRVCIWLHDWVWTLVLNGLIMKCYLSSSVFYTNLEEV
jgi:hypothetical protein